MRIRPEEQEAAQKPAELTKYEQMKAIGLPVWEGGLQDQPHIWLEQIGMIEAVKRFFAAQEAANKPPRGV